MKSNGGEKDARDAMADAVGRHVARKQKAQREGRRGLWFGFGMFGLIGWAIAVPTLIGVALGLWLDSHWPTGFSWTIALLFAGVFLGCINAWWWVQRESQSEDEKEDAVTAVEVALYVAVGTVLGGTYLFGLWMTVSRLGGRRRPLPFLAFSGVVRTALLLGALALVSGLEWKRLLACTAGVALARFVVTIWRRPEPAHRDSLS